MANLLCVTRDLERAARYFPPTEADGAQVIIEVDGPARFSNNSHRPLGRTMARRAMLEARGHVVRSIPFYEWAALTGLDQQKNYLWRLLASALGHQGGATLPRGPAQLSG